MPVCERCGGRLHLREGRLWKPCSCLLRQREDFVYAEAGLPNPLPPLHASTELRKAISAVTSTTERYSYVIYGNITQYSSVYALVKRFLDLGRSVRIIDFSELIKAAVGDSDFRHMKYDVVATVVGLDPVTKITYDVLRKFIYTRLATNKQTILCCFMNQLDGLENACAFGATLRSPPFLVFPV